MKQPLLSQEERRWRHGHAIAVLALVCFYLICPVAPKHWAALYSGYGKILIISVAAIYFYKQGLRGCMEVKLVIYYAIWLTLTRLLNTDFYLENEMDLVISRALCAVVMPVGLLLEPRDRERLLDWLSGILGGFYFIAAVAAIYACYTGSYFYIPPENVVFGIDSPDYFNHLVILQTSRTIFSVWLYISWCLMVYQFIRCRGKLWRVPIAIAWAVFHLAIALSFSRTTKLMVSVNVAMLLMLFAIKVIREKKKLVLSLLLSAAVLASAPVVYKSFDVLTDAVTTLSALTGADADRPSDAFLYSYGESSGTFSDPRRLTDYMDSGSSRSYILSSIIPTLKEDPMRLLIGKYSSKIMDIPHKYMNYTYTHMHNYLIQTLMLTGVLGALIVLAFSVLVVRRMILLFFSSDPAASLAVKSLILPVSGFFIYAMFDVLMFTVSSDDRSLTTDIRELCFFLLTGIALAYAYELAPDKRRRLKDSENGQDPA